MRARHLVLLAAAFGTAVLVPLPAAEGAPPGCQTEVPVTGDVDGDGLADLVVGLPGWDGTGAVDLRLTSAPSRLLVPADVGLQPDAGDAFGAAVALADLDADGCDDLVIGAPGTVDAGRVHVVFGAPDGFRPTGRLTLDADASPADRFGASVSVSERRGPAEQPAGADLWVGSPDDSPGAVRRAGSVAHFAVAGAGERPVLVEKLGQATPGVPGTPEVDDRFGAVLAARPSGVLVGVPQEDVGSRRDAGVVTALELRDAVEGVDDATSWTQDSAGVAGSAEAGDRFGAAVAASSGHALVGVPGEDVGSRRDAGMVQIFREPTGGGLPVPRSGLTEDSPGVPGTAEAGDELGAAVLVGANVGCTEGVVQAVAGAPGEDVRTNGVDRVDAGTVLVVPLTAQEDCPPRYDDQSNRLAGAAETRDRLGAVLGLGPVRDDHDDETGDRVYVGVPQEDRGTVTDAGLVVVTASGTGADAHALQVAGRRVPSVGSSRGAVRGQRYGSVLASPAG
ncbi:FG-GAP repeat-containing protein [Friedmanniella luteola]|uniref:FG-GAP repeat-containing protein n=1 Tax=Friedmanniella luteola TaxID=546871 RepID=A0A1H1VG24_9ACTN|nr:FG-GAP repeat protein [Friedmanniella luteola]SDS83754.1 FG-GAP repeat-containing protein [Friedmanniella luteola]